MILVSNNAHTNPYINLALEEYLVRHLDCSSTDYVLLYVNTPCVVLGKNQSVYREVNFDYLKKENAVIARRVSGGGTVYHDEGNLNFAFVSSFHNNKVNNYGYFNKKLIDGLKAVGIPAVMDVRNNIIVYGKKISGGAQFTNRKNIISHGTLLCNTNLSELRSPLQQNSFRIETNAPASVKSPVANLSEFDSSFKKVEQAKKLLVTTYKVNQTIQLNQEQWQQVEELAENKYRSFNWVYGRTPHTTIYRKKATIEVADGLVLKINSTTLPEDVIDALEGIFYTYKDVKKALSNIPNALSYLSEVF